MAIETLIQPRFSKGPKPAKKNLGHLPVLVSKGQGVNFPNGETKGDVG